MWHSFCATQNDAVHHNATMDIQEDVTRRAPQIKLLINLAGLFAVEIMQKRRTWLSVGDRRATLFVDLFILIVLVNESNKSLLFLRRLAKNILS